MTMPSIEGFTARPGCLADEWREPLDFPVAGLVPSSALAEIQRYPVGWLVVEQFVHLGDGDSDSASVVLIDDSATVAAFEDRSWSTDSIGSFSIINDHEVELGLSEPLGGGFAEFFCNVQRNHRVKPISVDMSLPFLWYWDAMRDGNNWTYLDSAGRERPLVRTTVVGDDYTVEVRALELRRYLAQRGLVALVQRDHVKWTADTGFEFAQFDYESNWCTFSWHASCEHPISRLTACSRLLGKHIVTGIDEGPLPAWLDYRSEDYESFVIRIDPATGREISFTSDPDQLSNYFGKNPDAPHYLTPVHFEASVLDRYLDEPERYSVSATRVACLDMWSISIGRTSTGGVEAYLGDLGRDLPHQEHSHWKAHNTPPRGRSNEDRFRRDFLGQWAGAMEPLDALRQAYADANAADLETLGWVIFRALPDEEQLAFERLQPPVLTSERALLHPVMTLTKALVDSIDGKAIRAATQSTEEGSLRLLESLVEWLGGDRALLSPVRDLYRLRSAGGLAHLAAESRQKTFRSVGIEGLTPAEAIEILATRLANSLELLSNTLREHRDRPSRDSDDQRS